MGVKVVNTFVGRDWKRSIPENWPAFDETLARIGRLRRRARRADRHRELPDALHPRRMARRARIWPSAPPSGGTMFEKIPSPRLGLNFDPSHLVFQHIDISESPARLPARDSSTFTPKTRASIGQARRRRHPRPRLARSQDPRPGRRRLGRASSPPSPMPATMAPSASRWKTGPTKARSPTASERCGRANAT